MTDYLDITVPHALGHAAVRLDSGDTLVVEHADPTVRIRAEVIGELADGTFPRLPGNVQLVWPADGEDQPDLNRHDGGYEIRLDSAGTVRYRPSGVDPDGINVVLVRIGGPDDPASDSYYRPGGRGTLPGELL